MVEIIEERRIDELDPVAGALMDLLGYFLPAMKDGGTDRISVQQIADLVKLLIVAGAPAPLDTLDKIAASINDDPDFKTTMATALAGKIAAAGGIAEDTFRIADPADPTRMFRWDAGNVPHNQTNVGTLPSISFSISDFFVSLMDDANAAAIWATLGGLGSAGATGYLKVPGGPLIQYGNGTTNGSAQLPVTFPLAFPVEFRGALVSVNGTANQIAVFNGASASGMNITTLVANSAAAAATINVFWIAIGR